MGLCTAIFSFKEEHFNSFVYFQEVIMKTKKFLVILSFIFFMHLSGFADYVGKTYVSSPEFSQFESFFSVQNQFLLQFFDQQIQRGNLVPFLVQQDAKSGMEHIRYLQTHRGLPVFGGEIIYHLKSEVVESITGEYYRLDSVETEPELTREEAVSAYRAYLSGPELIEKSQDTRLIIFPSKDGTFHLSWQITLVEEDHFSMTGFIDALTGEVLFQSSNIHFDEPAIGLGVNYHGLNVKLANTLYSDGYYYLYDEKRVRPFNHYTFNYDGNYIPGDADNIWDFDGAIVSAHALVGQVYDFYYRFFGREGINDKNLDTVVYVHNDKYEDNAFWNGESLNFCVQGKKKEENAACLDIVTHEYTHGVTEYSSDLVYSFESGALNESFSDIMGTTAEFYWHPEGIGLYLADWYIGEDARPYYNTSGCRNLANPNANSQLGDPNYPDPCHLSQKHVVPGNLDNGGVHLNSTIYAHAFYLLANGGRNSVSHILVNGIGIDKAAQIFYTAFVYYLTKNSDFMDAANALLEVAYSLYGTGSQEYQQTVKAMEAIGWIVY